MPNRNSGATEELYWLDVQTKENRNSATEKNQDEQIKRAETFGDRQNASFRNPFEIAKKNKADNIDDGLSYTNSSVDGNKQEGGIGLVSLKKKKARFNLD